MKTYLKWILGIVIIAAIIVAVVLTNNKPALAGETVKIGAAIGLTGDTASWGEMSLQGAQMAVEDLNKKGGINGKKVELVVEDMKSSSQGSISAVQKLISIDKVNAILGPTWIDVYQGAQGVVEGKNIVMITPDSGVEAFNTPVVNKNTFSLWYRSQPKAELLAKFLELKKVKRLVIIHQNDAYYNDLGARIEAEAAKHGITVVRHESINGGDTDFRTLLTKIKSDKADMVFFALYDQKAMDSFFKNRTQLALDVPLVTDEFGQDYLENPEYKSLVNDLYFFSATRQDDSFEIAFKKKYNGQIPKFGASNGYDSLMILAEALEKQPDDVGGYVKNTTFKTITFGDMKFDSINGVETKNETYIMKQIKDGGVILFR
jgi:branched-chain amino acid transport system substrate-binding protein